MPTAAELGSQLTTKRQEHGAFLAAFKTDAGYDMPTDKVGEFQTRNAELAEMQKAYETALAVEASAAENESKLAPQGRLVGDDIDTDSAEWKTWKSGAYDGPTKTRQMLDERFTKGLEKHRGRLDAISKGEGGISVSIPLGAGLKTVLATAVHAPQADRQGTFASPLFFGDIEDTIPHGATSSKSVDYYVQTTDTDNAAAVDEGSAATDSAFAWTLITDPVETVQTWIPITHEAVADNVGLQSTVEGMLARRLQKLSNKLILAGTGTTPEPTGIFVRSGFQTHAKGTDPAMDAFHKAITLVEVTGDGNATDIYAHPTDWQNIRLTRTTDGIYILGSPSDVGSKTLWGLPVHTTTGLGAAGTGGVADTSWSEVVEREGLVVQISTEHSTYFTERKVALMLYRRFAVATHRPSAACKVTGL